MAHRLGNVFRCTTLIALIIYTVPTNARADLASDLARCRSVPPGDERYDCYEKLGKRDVSAVHTEAKGATGATAENQTSTQSRWNTKGEFLRPHKPTYLVLRQSSSPNNNPFRESNEFASSAPGSLELDHNELKFQLSGKAALLDPKPWLGGASFWVGYTQQSYWQVWNASISRPFRESDYEPEAMLVWNPNIEFSGWKLNHVVGGFVHQSNGRGDPLSRSWNRLYAQLELTHERSGLEVIARPWLRLPEEREKDNNIDIQRYLGYADFLFNYRVRGVDTSLLVRNNLQARHNRSAFQLDLAFRCFKVGRFVPKLQVFIGPGESLIDYNHRQKSIGIGLEATGWWDHSFTQQADKCAPLPAKGN